MSAVVATDMLAVADVTRTFGSGRTAAHALRGVSFTVQAGQLVALRGRSGSGKTTLLNIVGGLDSPSSGRVLVDGTDITRMSERQLASVRNSKIGMVFQAYNLIPTLTAQENVEVPLYVGKHPELPQPSVRAKELLTLVGLGHRLGNRPNQLSGGEQQRVAVARALATRPAIVIMDEPTGNLDRTNGENVLRMIGDLRTATGTTFVIATHDPSVAAAADRAIHIVDGRIVSGEPQPQPQTEPVQAQAQAQRQPQGGAL